MAPPIAVRLLRLAVWLVAACVLIAASGVRSPASAGQFGQPADLPAAWQSADTTQFALADGQDAPAPAGTTDSESDPVDPVELQELEAALAAPIDVELPGEAFATRWMRRGAQPPQQCSLDPFERPPRVLSRPVFLA